MAKNRSYQIYELRDEFKKALDNLDFVEEQERKLAIVVSASNFAGEFKDFLNSLKENKKNYENQRAALKTRYDRANELIKLREDREHNGALVDDVISLTLEVLGAAKPDKKTQA